MAQMHDIMTRREGKVEGVSAKARAFVEGRQEELTVDEIAEFEEALEDPQGREWERMHAAEPLHLDPLDVRGFVFVETPVGVSFEEGMEVLRGIFHDKPITADRLWWVAKHGIFEKAFAAREVK